MASVTNPAETPLTTAEAAEILGVSVALVRLWAHRGKLKVYGHVKGKAVYSELDVLRLERDRRRGACAS